MNYPSLVCISRNAWMGLPKRCGFSPALPGPSEKSLLGVGLRTSSKRQILQMRMFLWGAILTLIAANMGWAQKGNSVVEAHAVMDTDAAHADSILKLAVLAQVAAGYHINAHKPSLDYLIPTELKVDPSDQFTVKNVVYPKGTLKKFPFSDVPLSVYEGNVVVGALLQAGKAVPAGPYTLKGKFVYQACNDHACLPPSSVPLTVTIRIVPRDAPLKPVESDVFQRIKFE
jgi:thioredoxin:protein disulfide reductase